MPVQDVSMAYAIKPKWHSSATKMVLFDTDLEILKEMKVENSYCKFVINIKEELNYNNG